MIIMTIAAKAITTLLQPDRQGQLEEAFKSLSGNLTRPRKWWQLYHFVKLDDQFVCIKI